MVNDRGECPVDEELAALALDPKTAATAEGFRQLWRRIPAEGPRKLGTSLYHLVDEENQIYEFIKGSHRLVAFTLDGAIVVCASAFRKSSQTTPRSVKKHAASLREKCVQAMRDGKFDIEGE